MPWLKDLVNIIIDSKVLISALVRDSTTREIIISSDYNFFLPEFCLDEIEEHKKELIDKSRLYEEDFDELLISLLSYVKIIKTKDVVEYRERAFEIIGSIDKDDAIFFACALAYPGSAIWSNDAHFERQDKIKIYTTKSLIEELFGRY